MKIPALEAVVRNAGRAKVGGCSLRIPGQEPTNTLLTLT